MWATYNSFRHRQGGIQLPLGFKCLKQLNFTCRCFWSQRKRNDCLFEKIAALFLCKLP